MGDSKWRVHILVNNVVKEGPYLGEHGLSMIVECPEFRDGSFILFDTGRSAEVLLKNAEQMGVEWSKVHTIVLSHSHYDHSGGLLGLVPRIGRTVSVIGHPATFVPRANRKPHLRDIGIPFSKEDLTALRVDFTEAKKSRFLTPNLIVTGEIPRIMEFEKDSSKGLLRQEHGEYVHDDVLDDRSLVIRVPGIGFHLICGCCHSGLLNTLSHAAELSGERQVLGIIGGLHLGSYEEESLNRVVTGLGRWNPELIVPLHCTGMRASAVLWKSFGDRVKFYTTGDTVELDQS
jgi:7,8-dihydropterin-6-yl-methyl-4-(beta-D-ribofuranosyl)aminobenzene 5'-phosphate synthase